MKETTTVHVFDLSPQQLTQPETSLKEVAL
jgi:hypothetical protein